MGKKKKISKVPVVRNCKRCGYQWEQRLHPEDMPRQCPDCKSNRWDRDETRKRASTHSEASQSIAATA